MTLFLFLVWLQMSAQPQYTTKIDFAENGKMVSTVATYCSFNNDDLACIDAHGSMFTLKVLCITKQGVKNCADVMKGMPQYGSGPKGCPPSNLQIEAANHYSLVIECQNGHFVTAQRAADETDGKPRQNMPPLPPSGSMECWNDAQTSDYLCQDSKGRTVDITKAMLRLMDEVDVPAVQVEKIARHKECINFPYGTMTPLGGWNPIWIKTCADEARVKRYTCADKSRVLLTSEDGKKWCHKVQP